MLRSSIMMAMIAIFLGALSPLYAANNPDITVSAVTGITGPSYIGVGKSASYTATLTWPTGVNNPGGQCTWSFDPPSLASITTTPNPGSTSTANTFNVEIKGIAPGAGKLKASWVTTAAGRYTSPAVAEIDVTVVKVSLVVTNATRDLMQTNTFEVTIDPSGTAASGYKIEMRRASGAVAWYELGTQQQLANFTQRVAGKFKLRGKATVGGSELTSQEEDLEVRFPTDSDILAGQGVRARMDQAWNDTKNATTTTSRREEGYYITIDTSSSGAYGITAHTIAAPVANNQGASWDTAGYPRPPDSIPNPTPLDQPTYTVGWFHTHTPTTYRNGGRGVGPSSGDFNWSADQGINIPGFAYDYTESPAGSGNIPAAHPINSAAQVYTITPPTRRPTP